MTVRQVAEHLRCVVLDAEANARGRIRFPSDPLLDERECFVLAVDDIIEALGELDDEQMAAIEAARSSVGNKLSSK